MNAVAVSTYLFDLCKCSFSPSSHWSPPPSILQLQTCRASILSWSSDSVGDCPSPGLGSFSTGSLFQILWKEETQKGLKAFLVDGPHRNSSYALLLWYCLGCWPSCYPLHVSWWHQNDLPDCVHHFKCLPWLLSFHLLLLPLQGCVGSMV